MTRSQRLAREWLWFVGSAVAVVVVTIGFTREGRIATWDEWQLGFMFGALFSIPAYLVTGAVRLTIWALSQVTEDE